MSQAGCLLVYATNETGLNFIQEMHHRNKCFIALTFISEQKDKFHELGVEVLHVQNKDEPFIPIPYASISKVFIFEDMVSECSKVIQYVCKNIPKKTIYVITHDNRPMLTHVYKELGADYVFYTHSKDVAFLLPEH